MAIAGLARVSTPPPYPQTVPDIVYYWNFLDVTNQPAVSNWIDRIKGSNVIQTAVSLQPTSSINGISFVGTQVLTNSLIPSLYTSSAGDGGITIWFILNKSYTDAAREFVATEYSSANPDGTSLENTFWLVKAVNVGRNGAGSGFRDFAITKQNGVSGVCYTNNVATSGVSTMTTWGAGLAFGNRSQGDVPLVGKLVEFAVFTNIQTATIRSNLHYYATNTYAFTP